MVGWVLSGDSRVGGHIAHLLQGFCEVGLRIWCVTF